MGAIWNSRNLMMLTGMCVCVYNFKPGSYVIQCAKSANYYHIQYISICVSTHTHTHTHTHSPLNLVSTKHVSRPWHYILYRYPENWWEKIQFDNDFIFVREILNFQVLSVWVPWEKNSYPGRYNSDNTQGSSTSLPLSRWILFENHNDNTLAWVLTWVPVPSAFPCREHGSTLCPLSEDSSWHYSPVARGWLALQKPCGYAAPAVFTKNAPFLRKAIGDMTKKKVPSDLCWAFTETSSGSFVSLAEYVSNNSGTPTYCPKQALHFPLNFFLNVKIQSESGQCIFCLFAGNLGKVKERKTMLLTY